METTAIVLISLFAVMISGFLARATRVPVPLVQIALGALIYYSSLTSVVLNPEVFFLLFLPPLLFLDGWRIPKDSLFRDASTILKLAPGLVVFTVLGMGLFIHWLIPSLPLAVSFALAAVISPTDPIAVSAIAARTPVPKRLLHILQGESLHQRCLRSCVHALRSRGRADRVIFTLKCSDLLFMGGAWRVGDRRRRHVAGGKNNVLGIRAV